MHYYFLNKKKITKKHCRINWYNVIRYMRLNIVKILKNKQFLCFFNYNY